MLALAKGGMDGTTSAHAENTRGVISTSISKAELPPRTRRIRRESLRFGGFAGTTSAHAENT